MIKSKLALMMDENEEIGRISFGQTAKIFNSKVYSAFVNPTPPPSKRKKTTICYIYIHVVFIYINLYIYIYMSKITYFKSILCYISSKSLF